MRTKTLWIATICLLVLFTACNNKKRGILTPTSSALPYELLVVMEDSVRNSDAGKELNKILTSDVPGLPQSESAFKLMGTTPRHFDGMLKPIRNIVIVNIDKQQYTKANMSAAKDVYSYPQNIITLTAPNTVMLESFLKEQGFAMVRYFTNAEMNRQISILERNHSDMASQLVKKQFDADVWLPSDLKFSKEGDNFLWIGTNEGDVNKYFVMYTIPYTDKNSFTKDYFIHKRDSVMKVNIPGESEGMYMSTEKEFVEVMPINVRGKYALEARGLWRMKNDFMGGPFVAHMRLDEANNRVVFTEIFVYAPEKMKRNLVRPMEASLYTVRFGESINGEESNTINE